MPHAVHPSYSLCESRNRASIWALLLVHNKTYYKLGSLMEMSGINIKILPVPLLLPFRSAPTPTETTDGASTSAQLGVAFNFHDGPPYPSIHLSRPILQSIHFIMAITGAVHFHLTESVHQLILVVIL